MAGSGDDIKIVSRGENNTKNRKETINKLR